MKCSAGCDYVSATDVLQTVNRVAQSKTRHNDLNRAVERVAEKRASHSVPPLLRSGGPRGTKPTRFAAAQSRYAVVYNRGYLYTQEVDMRTNVVIDDSLMESALKSSGLKTKKDAIEAGLKLLVKFKRQARIKKYRGRLKWVGNLDEMRTDK